AVCRGGMMITFEPHVAEMILKRWVTSEPGICWRPNLTPIAIERTGPLLTTVTFRAAHGNAPDLRLTGRTFVEASYEGDLMALAGAEFRVGREARAEFGEPSAGRVFTRWMTGVYPRAAAEGKLNLVTAKATTSAPLPGSTGEGDDNIQSYS